MSELKTGEKGVIVKVLGHGGFRKRIVEMGFVKGKTVEVLLNAPLKDPVKYKVMGYEISLRHQEAEMIEIVGEQEMLRDAVHLDYHEGMSEDMRLSEEELKRIALGKRRTINVALVGNPNCGKTSLFNIASGSHEHVGNYSGVTVDAKEGYFDFQGYHFRIVDLPGTYSLSAYSPEEIYVRHHIINETPDIIINVVDSSNLERNLYLTTQLIDMNVRMVIALNMYDELEASGNTLDYVKLGQLFGVPMLPTISRTGKGIEQLLNSITDKTKILVLPYPNNPTGAIMTKEELEELVPVIIEKDLYVISDEIYAELTYGGKRHCSIGSLPGMKERTIVINGFSKAFAMTGWRLGYACGPATVIEQMVKLHQFAIMCAPTNSQFAAVEALKNCDMEVEMMVEAYDQRRRFLLNAFKEMGLECFEPYGAFYVFPSIKKFGMTSEEFATRLLSEQKLAVVPGTAFGASGEGFVRISYAYSIENLKVGLERIQKFIESLGGNDGRI